MATSMQFGPEWMRKGPNSKSGGKENAPSATPSAATSPGTGPMTGSATPGGGNSAKRNGGIGGLANLSGPTPVVSPPVSSPGAFSFAAAAAAATAQNSERNGSHSSTPHGFSGIGGGSGGGESDASAPLLNGTSAALAKDKAMREKLLSLYSSDRSSKTASAEPWPVDAAPPIGSGNAGPERSTSTSRRKGGSDRRPCAFAELGAIGGGPVSPALVGNEPRGLNARSTSASFGSAGTLNSDKAEKERPGLFQRASSGALAGVNTNSGSRPLSPSVSRDRFSGIQGGVLSGVAPPARKRMESSDGGAAGLLEPTRTGRSIKSSQDETNTWQQSSNGVNGGAMGSWGRSASGQTGSGAIIAGAFSDAFSSNRVRGRNASAAAENASLATATPAQPIVPSGNPEGLSISARFARHKDRLPGEGPIGPPSDGSIGFGKSTGFERRRERQISQAAKPYASRGDAGIGAAPSAFTEKSGIQAQHLTGQNAGAGQHPLNSDDADLAQHASTLLGSLKLDQDDSPRLPTNAPLAGDEQNINPDPLANNNNHADNFHPRQHFDQQQHQNPNSHSQASMNIASWSPETSMWLYRDTQGNVQGPFNSLMMQDWYSQQYFTDDLPIRRQEDADFRPLAQVVAAVGNALQPFVIPPSNWLYSPNLPRPPFDSILGRDNLRGSEQQSRFTDAFDSNRSWPGPAARQQQGWPAQLGLAGLGNVGPSPASPFGRPDVFSAGQAGLRNQDEIMSIIRERELQEQRQAAAATSRGPGGMSLGQLDGFGGGLDRSGWGVESAMSPSPWAGMSHSSLGQFGDVGGLGAHHQSPLVGGDRPAFDNFAHQQKQTFDQTGNPWTEKASLAPRSHPMAGAGQWGEQPQQQQQQQAAPWNFSATTPDVNNRQMDFSEGILRNEAIKAADPIGTPRRARSPAPQHHHDVGAAAEHRDEQQKSFENAFPAPTLAEQQAANNQAAPAAAEAKPASEQRIEASRTEAAKPAAAASTPQKKLSKKEAQKAAAAATPTKTQEPAQPAKTAETEIPPPEAFTASEPRPEELWPQSPKAVEFASEPELSGMPALTLSNKKDATNKREQRSALQRQTSERNVPGSGETAASRTSANRPTGASNVRVVTSDQFRRPKESESTSASGTQASLSEWLNDGNASDSSAPASKPAPWAAKDDSNPQSTGPSLREIQEAEAKRAEAKRAAEKAAARARLTTASPSGGEELPTTLSWGLASAPAAIAKTAAGGEGASGGASAGGPAAPAWNAGKAAPKKTLMEIQEEERKRAEKLKAQQIALKKGYADSASRTAGGNLHGAVVAPTTNAASGGGGAWSVVGASGKPTTPSTTPSSSTNATGAAAASPLASRPTLTSTRSTSTTTTTAPTSSSGAGAWSVVGSAVNTATKSTPASPSPATRTASSTLTKPRPSTSTDPNAPSPEFIRYCKDNLAGLHINKDDFIDMLLQFPLDPSSDVIEIIADTVYANSGTLDGRRFALDFVSKRKLDVQGRGADAAGAGGMASFGAGVKQSAVKTGGKTGVSGSVPGAATGGEAFKVVKKGGKKRA